MLYLIILPGSYYNHKVSSSIALKGPLCDSRVIRSLLTKQAVIQPWKAVVWKEERPERPVIIDMPISINLVPSPYHWSRYYHGLISQNQLQNVQNWPCETPESRSWKRSFLAKTTMFSCRRFHPKYIEKYWKSIYSWGPIHPSLHFFPMLKVIFTLKPPINW